MKYLILATVAALALAPAALAAPASPNGVGKGAVRANPAAAAAQRGGWNNNTGAWTSPAGQVHPHGMPPGQAKKLGVGAVLPPTYPGFRRVTDYRGLNLPAAPAGYEYARVGNDVYLRQANTGVVSRVIENLFR